MPYTDEAGVTKLVSRLYPNGFPSQTAPDTIQLLALIDEHSAEIDMVLGTVGYTTPVTTPASAVTWLKLVCEYGVAAAAIKSAFPETIQSNNGGPAIPAYAFWEKRYQDALKALRERTITLPGVVMSGSQNAQTYLTDNPTNDPFNDGFETGQQPVFSTLESLREF